MYYLIIKILHKHILNNINHILCYHQSYTTLITYFIIIKTFRLLVCIQTNKYAYMGSLSTIGGASCGVQKRENKIVGRYDFLSDQWLIYEEKKMGFCATRKASNNGQWLIALHHSSLIEIISNSLLQPTPISTINFFHIL